MSKHYTESKAREMLKLGGGSVSLNPTLHANKAKLPVFEALVRKGELCKVEHGPHHHVYRPAPAVG